MQISTEVGNSAPRKSIEDINLLEGHYDSGAVDPAVDPNVPGAKIYDEYCKKLGLETAWNVVAVQAAIMELLPLRAVERAAAAVGADNITGEAMYNAMYAAPFTEDDLLGLASTLTFTKEAPFSTQDLKVKATTIKDGKQMLVSDDWIPVPAIPKWVKK